METIENIRQRLTTLTDMDANDLFMDLLTKDGADPIISNGSFHVGSAPDDPRSKKLYWMPPVISEADINRGIQARTYAAVCGPDIRTGLDIALASEDLISALLALVQDNPRPDSFTLASDIYHCFEHLVCRQIQDRQRKKIK